MKLTKINLHSSVDLITNSSTVIYTYSEGSESAVKDMVNEMLKVLGHEDKSFDDLFHSGVFLSDNDVYLESDKVPEEFSHFPEEFSHFNSEGFSEFIKKVIKGELKKPEWMSDVEEEEDWNCFRSDTSLYLISKDEKYEKLGNKIIKFLYSTNHEATRDG